MRIFVETDEPNEPDTYHFMDSTRGSVITVCEADMVSFLGRFLDAWDDLDIEDVDAFIEEWATKLK